MLKKAMFLAALVYIGSKQQLLRLFGVLPVENLAPSNLLLAQL